MAAILFMAPGCAEQNGASATENGEPRVIAPRSYKELQQIFSSLDYDLSTLEQGVPRLMLTRMPADMEHLSAVNEKKRIFVLSMLPMALMANEEISLQRDRLLEVLDRHRKNSLLSGEDRLWLTELTREYGLTGDPLADPHLRDRLLERVDIIPPSLVLAQAANESAWGTSRFTKAANNLFGEWTFTPGTGIVPKRRPKGATYEVRKFDNVYQSVRSYMRNLNTHRAYRPLRLIRSRLRERGLEPKGLDMAAGLEKYSIRRDAYVREIRAMIHHNKLTLLSQATLQTTAPPANIP